MGSVVPPNGQGTAHHVQRVWSFLKSLRLMWLMRLSAAVCSSMAVMTDAGFVALARCGAPEAE